jgi:hypothetical protein
MSLLALLRCPLCGTTQANYCFVEVTAPGSLEATYIACRPSRFAGVRVRLVLLILVTDVVHQPRLLVLHVNSC